MSGAGRLSEPDLAAVDAALAEDDRARLALYPGGAAGRQPVHTVYVPAHRWHAGLVAEWGATALDTLAAHAPDPAALARVTGLSETEVAAVWELVRGKLGREPIEDLRVDLEDGYGTRPDAEEDGHSVAAGRALGRAYGEGGLPPFSGIRFKSLEGATRRRGLRSLDLVVESLLEAAGELPTGWRVTLPKVTSVAQVAAMVDVCGRLEGAYGLPAGRLVFEIQVETPQAVLLADGTAGVARMVHAAEGRCVGLHFGTYDYTAALGVAGGYQALDHPAADAAKAVMQLAVAGTGVALSDGSTNILPVGDEAAVHAGWSLHARLVGRSLRRGFYQGWDLHPAQLPTRFLATYVFFRTGLDRIGSRLNAYLHGAEGTVLDEPATAQALAAFLVRGVRCGAVTDAEISRLTGSDFDTLTLLANRRVG